MTYLEVFKDRRKRGGRRGRKNTGPGHPQKKGGGPRQQGGPHQSRQQGGPHQQWSTTAYGPHPANPVSSSNNNNYCFYFLQNITIYKL